jgi:hypothetical protein
MEMGGQLHYPATLPTGKNPVVRQQAGWTPEPMGTFQRREKFPACTEIRTPDRPANSLVVIPKELYKYIYTKKN